MAHFAHITNGVVDQVIVIDQEVLEQAGGWSCFGCGGQFRPTEEWVQTSYNTVHGEHKLGGIPVRKNYAGIGFTYDKVRDAFIEPKPFDSFILDEEKCAWVPPKALPVGLAQNEAPRWNESTKDWDIVHNVKCSCGTCMLDPTRIYCVPYEEYKANNP